MIELNSPSQIIENALINNGIITIINWNKIKNNPSYKEKKEVLIHFSEHQLNSCDYIVQTLSYSKSKVISQIQKDFIDKVFIDNNEKEVRLSVLGLFDCQSLDELKLFSQFFGYMKMFYVENYIHRPLIKILYETKPLRIEFHFKAQKNNKLYTTENNHILSLIDEHAPISRWCNNLAKSLRMNGRYSFISLSEMKLFSGRESYKILYSQVEHLEDW